MNQVIRIRYIPVSNTKPTRLSVKTSGGNGMLILTRRIGETLMIGDEVSVTVLDVKGRQVRIGINAPRAVGIYRQEIYERIQKEKRGGSDESNIE